MQHLPQRDRFAIVGQFRNVLMDIIVQREETLLRGKDDAGRGELLRDRCHIKYGGWRKRNAQFHTGETVSLAINEGPVSDYSERTPRGASLLVRSEQLVHRLLICLHRKHGSTECYSPPENNREFQLGSPDPTTILW